MPARPDKVLLSQIRANVLPPVLYVQPNLGVLSKNSHLVGSACFRGWVCLGEWIRSRSSRESMAHRAVGLVNQLWDSRFEVSD